MNTFVYVLCLKNNGPVCFMFDKILFNSSLQILVCISEICNSTRTMLQTVHFVCPLRNLVMCVNGVLILSSTNVHTAKKEEIFDIIFRVISEEA